MKRNWLLKIMVCFWIVANTSCKEPSSAPQFPASKTKYDKPSTEADFIRDENIPNCIKGFYLDSISPNAFEDCAFSLYDSIQSKDSSRQPFYFIALTNTFEKADGAYSEATCEFAKEYVAKETKKFITQLINNKLLSTKDIALWADRVMMGIIDFAAKDATQEVALYIQALRKESIRFNDIEKTKLEEFITCMNSYVP